MIADIRPEDLALIQRHKRSGVLLDTNLLLLLLVGAGDRSWIRQHKRTSMFWPADFDLLTGLVAGVEKLVTTPNILTETCNLLFQGPKGARKRVLANLFGRFIQTNTEIYVDSRRVVLGSIAHDRFGLADAALMAWPADDPLVLTKDKPLFFELQARGIPSIDLFPYLEVKRRSAIP